MLIAPAAPVPPGGGQFALDLVGIDSGPNRAHTLLDSLRTGPAAPCRRDHLRLSRQSSPGQRCQHAFYDFDGTRALIALASAFA